MPVHLDTHDPDVDLRPGTTKSDIVAFLYNNPEYGYKPSEVSDHLDIPHGTATTTLKRLHEAGYIGKTDDSYYHALEHREALRRYVAGLDQLDRMFTQPTDKGRPPTSDTEDAFPERIDDAEIEHELAELEDELEG
jgi:DNA-binding MarR family transcriptional regulator